MTRRWSKHVSILALGVAALAAVVIAPRTAPGEDDPATRAKPAAAPSAVNEDVPFEPLEVQSEAELLRPASPAAAPRRKLQVIRMEVTAYCACKKCCGPNAQGITASGRRVSYNKGRFVAADTDLLPFGKRLSIPGYHGGAAVEVLDTGSAIKGNRLDVYFPSHQTALEWGRRVVNVTILE